MQPQRDSTVLQRLNEVVQPSAKDHRFSSTTCLSTIRPPPPPHPHVPSAVLPGSLSFAKDSVRSHYRKCAGFTRWRDAWWQEHARLPLEDRQRQSSQRERCSRQLERQRPLDVEAVHEPSNVTNRLSYHLDPEDRWRPDARRVRTFTVSVRCTTSQRHCATALRPRCELYMS